MLSVIHLLFLWSSPAIRKLISLFAGSSEKSPLICQPGLVRWKNHLSCNSLACDPGLCRPLHCTMKFINNLRIQSNWRGEYTKIVSLALFILNLKFTLLNLKAYDIFNMQTNIVKRHTFFFFY